MTPRLTCDDKRKRFIPECYVRALVNKNLVKY